MLSFQVTFESFQGVQICQSNQGFILRRIVASTQLISRRFLCVRLGPGIYRGMNMITYVEANGWMYVYNSGRFIGTWRLL